MSFNEALSVWTRADLLSDTASIASLTIDAKNTNFHHVEPQIFSINNVSYSDSIYCLYIFK